MAAVSVPRVSVILPVYNGAAYVQAAIDSILAQTLSDFELIVIDDGSTDATAQIVGAVADPRLVFIQQPNKGLAAALNRGIAAARGAYLARHDHDDLSLPARFEKQAAFLDSHPDHALVGTHSAIWEGDRPTERRQAPPADDADLRFELLFDCFFVHGSVMMRRDEVMALGGYTTDPERQPPEDYELWSRLVRRHKVANLPEPLLVYREVPGSISRTVNFKDNLVKICSENLAHAAGIDSPTTDTQDIAALIHRTPGLLSRRPDFGCMGRILRQAAENIDRAAPGGSARARAEAVILDLKRRSTLMWYDRLPVFIRRPIHYARRLLVAAFPWLRSVRRRLSSAATGEQGR